MSIEAEIQRELTRLDPDLWLNKEWSPFGYVFYSVKYGKPGPKCLTALEWRDGSGPYPLSTNIVDAVKRQEGDIRDAIKTATVNNAALKELRRQESLQAYEDIAQEHQKFAKKHYVVPPKGVSRALD